MISLATAENSTILLHPSDNVAIARVPVGAGMKVRGVVTRAAIAAGHKVAIRAIAPGENVIRYGQFIGRAKTRIEPGDHVHTHNLAFEELNLDYEFPSAEIPI